MLLRINQEKMEKEYNNICKESKMRHLSFPTEQPSKSKYGDV